MSAAAAPRPLWTTPIFWLRTAKYCWGTDCMERISWMVNEGDDMQTATCGSVSIKVLGSTVEGDIGGGSSATADGIIDIGTIDIFAKDSNIASNQAGGDSQ